jgi:hypothetical protein
MLEIIVASFVENGVSQPKNDSRSERPSTAKSQRYKAPDTLDMSPVLDRPISPTSERRTSQNGLSSASAKKRVNSKLYLKYK